MGKEIKSIQDLPGIGPQASEKLISAGYKTLESMAVASPMELIEVAGLGEGTAEKAIKAARDALEMGFETADVLAEKRKLVGKITTGSKEVDSLIGGGIETQSITEIYGKFASSKSQWCFETAVTVQLPKEKGGLEGNCLYIDSENSFRPERIIQIAKHLKLDPENVLKNIYVARAYNSLQGSEPVSILNDAEFHNTDMADVVENRQNNEIVAFSFNPENGGIVPAKVTSLISHPIGRNNELYKIETVFGRELTVTGSHSVFRGQRFGKKRKTVRREKGNMRPEAYYASLLKTGDYIAIPRCLPVTEEDIEEINLAIACNKFPKEIKKEIVIERDGENEFIKLKHTGKRKATRIPSRIKVDNDLLWLLGFWIAEGNSQYKERPIRLRINSEEELCAKAKRIIEEKFLVKTFLHKIKGRNGALLLIPSRLLCLVLKYCFELPIGTKSPERTVPGFVFKLPKEKVKHFIKGYWDGDGYHANSRPKNRLIFITSSKKLAHDTTMLLLRFKVVAAIQKLRLKNAKKHWKQPYRIEAAGLNINDPLQLDKVKQNLNTPTWDDLAFARIKAIERIRVNPKEKVYDFAINSASAPYQNFVAGFGGVCCHNSDHQMLLAEKAAEMIKEKNIKLLIVDSLIAQFRSEFIGRGMLADRQQKLNKHLRTLAKLAEMNNIAVLVTNQVMQRPDILFGDPTAPVGGEILAHAAKTRIYLRKSKEDKRVAKLVDSPSLPDGEAIFRVTENGLEDVEE